MRNMIIKRHISLKQNTEIFYRVKINVYYWRINISGIKKEDILLLRLVDNMLTTNKEKTPLMQDSITNMADDACSRENEIYICVSFA